MEPIVKEIHCCNNGIWKVWNGKELIKINQNGGKHMAIAKNKIKQINLCKGIWWLRVINISQAAGKHMSTGNAVQLNKYLQKCESGNCGMAQKLLLECI